MHKQHKPKPLWTLDVAEPIWDRFFMVAPLVLIGSREADGNFDLAPKHMASPMGWQNYFGFVCAPRHRTCQNIEREGVFTVSFPRPTQVILTSLAAVSRCDDGTKPILKALPTFSASKVAGVLVEDSYLYFECELDRIIGGFGDNCLITGRIVCAHAAEDALRGAETDDQDLIHKEPILAYLHPGRFARVTDSFSFPFPADFKK